MKNKSFFLTYEYDLPDGAVIFDIREFSSFSDLKKNLNKIKDYCNKHQYPLFFDVYKAQKMSESEILKGMILNG